MTKDPFNPLLIDVALRLMVSIVMEPFSVATRICKHFLGFDIADDNFVQGIWGFGGCWSRCQRLALLIQFHDILRQFTQLPIEVDGDIMAENLQDRGLDSVRLCLWVDICS
jgi:hypothetical protein